MGVLVRIARRVAAHGLVWAFAWAAYGVILVTIIGQVDPDSIDEGEGQLPVAWILGRAGAAAGAFFGLLLALLERDRSVAGIPLLRFLSWSVLAGAALPLLTPMNNNIIFNTVPFAVITSLGTWFVARRRHAIVVGSVPA